MSQGDSSEDRKEDPDDKPGQLTAKVSTKVLEIAHSQSQGCLVEKASSWQPQGPWAPFLPANIRLFPLSA